jgi:hypothetical protein
MYTCAAGPQKEGGGGGVSATGMIYHYGRDNGLPLLGYPAERCTFCLCKDSERTENLSGIGTLPANVVPLIEVRL